MKVSSKAKMKNVLRAITSRHDVERVCNQNLPNRCERILHRCHGSDFGIVGRRRRRRASRPTFAVVAAADFEVRKNFWKEKPVAALLSCGISSFRGFHFSRSAFLKSFSRQISLFFYISHPILKLTSRQPVVPLHLQRSKNWLCYFKCSEFRRDFVYKK